MIVVGVLSFLVALFFYGARLGLLIGLESDHGWIPGILDELRFYATAVPPFTAPAPAGVPHPTSVHWGSP